MSGAAPSGRRALLARVHIAKKEMRLEDASYRDVLARVTGRESSASCTDAQLITLLDEFRKLGWKPRTGKRPHADPQVRMVFAIWKDIRPLLDGTAGERELRGFVRRMTKDANHPDGIDAVEFCDQRQLVILIEGLKAWRARLRRKEVA